MKIQAKTATNRAIGYVRVSTEEQSREGVSLDAQIERLTAYATMRGLELVEIFREEGVSAKSLLHERPEGSKLVKLLKAKKAQHVLTVKMDRLFRNASNALQQSSEWDKAKVALHILDMGGSVVDTASAMGRMFFTMAAGWAEMERNLISERTKTALQFKKNAHRVYTRIAPLGFDRSEDKLIVNAEEMKTVQSIQAMRLEGMSYQDIADQLTDTGAVTKMGGAWHAMTVHKIMRLHPNAA